MSIKDYRTDYKYNLNNQREDKNKINSYKDSIYSFFIFTNIYLDIVVYFLIAFGFYCSILMYYGLEEHNKKLKAFNPSYEFPRSEDLALSIWIFFILMFVHKIFKVMTIDTIQKYLTKKYDHPDEIIIYKNKVSTNFIKFILYTSSTILGFYALRDLNFFPWTLGGKGEFKNLFKIGYPDYLFFEKTKLFDFYYNFNLAFSLFDTYILISYPSQSDFLLMILHHMATLNLVIFSFLTNYSNIGCIVYFIHYSGDILSMIIRILIHLEVTPIISCYLTFAFLAIFSYTRLFVFGDVLYNTYSFIFTYDYNIYSLYLCCFLSIIMILNIIWIVLISIKVYKFLLTGKVEEIYKIKKISETKKE
jgi:hypothetical protein